MSRLGKLARLVGAIGGIGAIAWAMRDRFVSIAVPREPDPPSFRTPATSPKSTSSVSETTDDLTEVNGIGPVYAERLHTAGFRSFDDIALATDAALAKAADVSEARVSSWRATARGLAGT